MVVQYKKEYWVTGSILSHTIFLFLYPLCNSVGWYFTVEFFPQTFVENWLDLCRISEWKIIWKVGKNSTMNTFVVARFCSFLLQIFHLGFCLFLPTVNGSEEVSRVLGTSQSTLGTAVDRHCRCGCIIHLFFVGSVAFTETTATEKSYARIN